IPMEPASAGVFGGLRSPASVPATQVLGLPRLRDVPVKLIAKPERAEAQSPGHQALGSGSARRSDTLREPALELLSRVRLQQRHRAEPPFRPAEPRWLRRL